MSTTRARYLITGALQKARPFPYPRASSLSRIATWTGSDRLWLLLLGLGAFALYAATLVPGPFDGDYGEFQYMPRLLGLPHPTGYPLYLLLGWLWSWLPAGSLAFRLNLFSALWAAFTVTLLFAAARQQRLPRVAALVGGVALALAPNFWRYAGLAAVYTLHTTLLVAALWLWFRWSTAYRRGCGTRRELGLAALMSGLALTNHPTAAFLVPAIALFLLLHLLPGVRPPETNPVTPRDRLLAGLLFTLPGLLYLYVPLRLWMIGPGIERFGLQESIAKGIITPFLRWEWGAVLEYVTGRSLLGSYGVDGALLLAELPPLLVEQFGLPLTLLGAGGAVTWAWRRPRTFILLATFFLPAAAYAVTYAAEFAARDEIAHLEGHLLGAMVVFALWIAEGGALLWRILHRLTHHAWTVDALLILLLGAMLWNTRSWETVPTSPDRAQSESIHNYWTEVLAYPLEPGAALTGHWGDLTAFWYFQHGEGLRSDLWTIFPPNLPQIARWLSEGARPIYLAGPLLDWGTELPEGYHLTPWGILVRIAPQHAPPSFPPLQARNELFGNQLALQGYTIVAPAPDRRQLWLAWESTAPTPRDLSVSLRLHGPDETLLLQKDGRLASLWYPNEIMPAGQALLTVFDFE
ncbi:MAG: DUF2723 domain-containing protein, partial [Chloroflexota bacterium]|nr:DUF2723 domain-containing protein [Chloroflexota bacterium]